MSDSSPNDCPFCHIPPERVVESNTWALVIADAFPVSPGHSLVVLRRHTATIFDLTGDELAAVYELVGRTKDRLEAAMRPDGYNIGINQGLAAGQTIMHLHIHLIPRFGGDVAQPRGGVRNVIPGKGDYRPPGSSEDLSCPVGITENVVRRQQP